MGTGGKTFNAHVISATWHQKHVRPAMVDDSYLRRGIGELFSRWGGLQMAVKNQKSQELAHDLFHLCSQSNVITVEEIESFLHESLLLSFNTEIEDGSIEETMKITCVGVIKPKYEGSHSLNGFRSFLVDKI